MNIVNVMKAHTLARTQYRQLALVSSISLQNLKSLIYTVNETKFPVEIISTNTNKSCISVNSVYEPHKQQILH